MSFGIHHKQQHIKMEIDNSEKVPSVEDKEPVEAEKKKTNNEKPWVPLPKVFGRIVVNEINSPFLTQAQLGGSGPHLTYYRAQLSDNSGKIALSSGMVVRASLRGGRAGEQKPYIFIEMHHWPRTLNSKKRNRLNCLAYDPETNTLANAMTIIELSNVSSVDRHVTSTLRANLLQWLTEKKMVPVIWCLDHQALLTDTTEVTEKRDNLVTFREAVYPLMKLEQSKEERDNKEKREALHRKQQRKKQKASNAASSVIVLQQQQPPIVVADEDIEVLVPMIVEKEKNVAEKVAKPVPSRHDSAVPSAAPKRPLSMVVTDTFQSAQEQPVAKKPRLTVVTQDIKITIQFDGQTFDSLEAVEAYCDAQLRQLRAEYARLSVELKVKNTKYKEDFTKGFLEMRDQRVSKVMSQSDEM
jgi:hypothetical protein